MKHTAGNVFVVGRLPKVTYNPRHDRGLEPQLRTYLDDRGTILSVSGATKTGKTVLLRSVAPDAVMLSGGTITDVNEMWGQISEKLDLWREVSTSAAASKATAYSASAAAGGGPLTVEGSRNDRSEKASEDSASRTVSPKVAVLRELSSALPILVIDDFHYVDREVQLDIVRGLKELVFDGLGVILASVPHRAFDAVRVEKEMTGRVTHLSVQPWSEQELQEIASLGFEALNLVDPKGEVAKRLARESFASPYLMQTFCRRICRLNGYEEQQPAPQQLSPPSDWNAFFREAAVDTSKTAFDVLRQGPRQRSDRKQRVLNDGRSVDIYGAVLAAIAATGPRLSIEYEELRAALRELMSTDTPQRHEVTRVLDQMTRTAREKVEGEPVLEYDDHMSTLHISDPYFAFYLRWGEGALDDDGM